MKEGALRNVEKDRKGKDKIMIRGRYFNFSASGGNFQSWKIREMREAPCMSYHK